MSNQDARKEQRVNAMMRVRLRCSGNTFEAGIRNVSPRGISVVTTNPMERGEIVEFFVDRQVLVGQVKWSRGNLVGVVLRDRINVAAFTQRQGGPIKVENKSAGQKEEVAKPALVDHLYVIAAGMGALAFLTYAVKVWL